MNKYIMVFALLGALLVVAPAVKADYHKDEWGYYWFGRWGYDEEWGDYFDGAVAYSYLSLTKGGGETVTDGTVSWDIPIYEYPGYVSPFSVTGNYQGDPNQYWIGYNSRAPYLPGSPSIILTGSIGSPGLFGLVGATGLLADVSIEVDGLWYSLASLQSSLASGYGLPSFEYQSYLNGVKTDSTDVNEANDSMVTLLWFDEDFADLFYYSGGFGVRIAPDARNMTFEFVSVVPSPVPEPATLAVVWLGLAGLGLARRRRK